MIGSKTATDMKQLAGKKIGIGRVGDPPYHMAISLLRKHGYTARDVQWVSVGVDAATRAAALQSGQIDAALITAPAYFRLQAAGLPVLATLLDHDDIYVSTYYLFRRDALTKERPTAIAFIKAHAEAIKRFYDDRAFAAETMIKYGGTRNIDDANRVYELFRKARVLEPIPYALKGSVDAVSSGRARISKGVDFSQDDRQQSGRPAGQRKIFRNCFRTVDPRRAAAQTGSGVRQVIVNCRRPTTRRLGEFSLILPFTFSAAT